MALTDADEQEIQAAARDRNKYFETLQDLQFTFHEQEQRQTLVWLQVMNLLGTTILLLFLVFYFRPDGLWTYMSSGLQEATAKATTAVTDSFQSFNTPASILPPAADVANSKELMPRLSTNRMPKPTL
jgi:hypothetical protein